MYSTLIKTPKLSCGGFLIGVAVFVLLVAAALLLPPSLLVNAEELTASTSSSNSNLWSYTLDPNAHSYVQDSTASQNIIWNFALTPTFNCSKSPSSSSCSSNSSKVISAFVTRNKIQKVEISHESGDHSPELDLMFFMNETTLFAIDATYGDRLVWWQDVIVAATLFSKSGKSLENSHYGNESLLFVSAPKVTKNTSTSPIVVVGTSFGTIGFFAGNGSVSFFHSDLKSVSSAFGMVQLERHHFNRSFMTNSNFSVRFDIAYFNTEQHFVALNCSSGKIVFSKKVVSDKDAFSKGGDSFLLQNTPLPALFFNPDHTANETQAPPVTVYLLASTNKQRFTIDGYSGEQLQNFSYSFNETQFPSNQPTSWEFNSVASCVVSSYRMTFYCITYKPLPASWHDSAYSVTPFRFPTGAYRHPSWPMTGFFLGGSSAVPVPNFPLRISTPAAVDADDYDGGELLFFVANSSLSNAKYESLISLFALLLNETQTPTVYREEFFFFSFNYTKIIPDDNGQLLLFNSLGFQRRKVNNQTNLEGGISSLDGAVTNSFTYQVAFSNLTQNRSIRTPLFVNGTAIFLATIAMTSYPPPYPYPPPRVAERNYILAYAPCAQVYYSYNSSEARARACPNSCKVMRGNCDYPSLTNGVQCDLLSNRSRACKRWFGCSYCDNYQLCTTSPPSLVGYMWTYFTTESNVNKNCSCGNLGPSSCRLMSDKCQLMHLPSSFFYSDTLFCAPKSLSCSILSCSALESETECVTSGCASLYYYPQTTTDSSNNESLTTQVGYTSNWFFDSCQDSYYCQSDYRQSCFHFLLETFVPLPYLFMIVGLAKDVVVLVLLGVFGSSVRHYFWKRKEVKGKKEDSSVVYVFDSQCRDGEESCWEDYVFDVLESEFVLPEKEKSSNNGYGSVQKESRKKKGEKEEEESEKEEEVEESEEAKIEREEIKKKEEERKMIERKRKEQVVHSIAFSLWWNQVWVDLVQRRKEKEEFHNKQQQQRSSTAAAATAASGGEGSSSNQEEQEGEESLLASSKNSTSAEKDNCVPCQLNLEDFSSTSKLQEKIDKAILARKSYFIFYSTSREISIRMTDAGMNMFPSLTEFRLYLFSTCLLAAATVAYFCVQNDYYFLSSSRCFPNNNVSNPLPSASLSYEVSFLLMGYRLLNSSSFSLFALVLVKVVRGLTKLYFRDYDSMPLAEKLPILAFVRSKVTQVVFGFYVLLFAPFALVGPLYGLFATQPFGLVGFPLAFTAVSLALNALLLYYCTNPLLRAIARAKLYRLAREQKEERRLQKRRHRRAEAAGSEIGMSSEIGDHKNTQQKEGEANEQEDDDEKVAEIPAGFGFHADDEDDDDDSDFSDRGETTTGEKKKNACSRYFSKFCSGFREFLVNFLLFAIRELLPAFFIFFAFQTSFNYTVMILYKDAFRHHDDMWEIIRRDYCSRASSCTFDELEGSLALIMSFSSSFVPFF